MDHLRGGDTAAAAFAGMATLTLTVASARRRARAKVRARATSLPCVAEEGVLSMARLDKGDLALGADGVAGAGARSVVSDLDEPEREPWVLNRSREALATAEQALADAKETQASLEKELARLRGERAAADARAERLASAEQQQRRLAEQLERELLTRQVAEAGELDAFREAKQREVDELRAEKDALAAQLAASKKRYEALIDQMFHVETSASSQAEWASKAVQTDDEPMRGQRQERQEKIQITPPAPKRDSESHELADEKRSRVVQAKIKQLDSLAIATLALAWYLW